MDKDWITAWKKGSDRRGNGDIGEHLNAAGQAVKGAFEGFVGGVDDLVKKLVGSGKSKDEKAEEFARLIKAGKYKEVHDAMGLKDFADLRDYAISKGIIDGDEYDTLVKDANAASRTPEQEAAKPTRDPESKDLFNQTINSKTPSAPPSSTQSAPSTSFDYSTNKTGKANSSMVAQYEPAPTGGRERTYSAVTEGYQTKLNALGFSVGEADGLYGDATKAGVLKFQKANGLNQTGNIDQATADKIDELSTSQDDTQATSAGGILD